MSLKTRVVALVPFYVRSKTHCFSPLLKYIFHKRKYNKWNNNSCSNRSKTKVSINKTKLTVTISELFWYKTSTTQRQQQQDIFHRKFRFPLFSLVLVNSARLNILNSEIVSSGWLLSWNWIKVKKYFILSGIGFLENCQTICEKNNLFSSGYGNRFKIYVNKDEIRGTDILASECVVLKMAQSILKKCYTLFMDNWYLYPK